MLFWDFLFGTFFFEREYTKINFYLVSNSLLQNCSRTSPAQAKQLLLPDLVRKSFPLIRMISMSVGPGLGLVWCYDRFPEMRRCTSGNLKKEGGRKAWKLSLQKDVELITSRSPRDLGPHIAAAFVHNLWQPLMLSRGTELL